MGAKGHLAPIWRNISSEEPDRGSLQLRQFVSPVARAERATFRFSSPASKRASTTSASSRPRGSATRTRRAPCRPLWNAIQIPGRYLRPWPMARSARVDGRPAVAAVTRRSRTARHEPVAPPPARPPWEAEAGKGEAARNDPRRAPARARHGDKGAPPPKRRATGREDLELTGGAVLFAQEHLDRHQFDTLALIAEWLRRVALAWGGKDSNCAGLWAALLGASTSTRTPVSAVRAGADAARRRLARALRWLDGLRDLVVTLAEGRIPPLVFRAVEHRLLPEDKGDLARGLAASHGRRRRMQFPVRPSRCVGCGWPTRIPARLSMGPTATIRARSKASSTSSAFFSATITPGKRRRSMSG
jgi:hypothetical protein